MADIQINATCGSNSKQFPKGTSSISFHAAKACTLTFSVPNCFAGNPASLPLAAQETKALTVATDTATTFVPSGCPNKASEDTYDITFGSAEGQSY